MLILDFMQAVCGLPAGYLQAQTGQPAGYLQAALQALPGPKH